MLTIGTLNLNFRIGIQLFFIDDCNTARFSHLFRSLNLHHTFRLIPAFSTCCLLIGDYNNTTALRTEFHAAQNREKYLNFL